MAAAFGARPVDENLVYGWSIQQTGATAGQTGYAEPANVPATPNVSTALQASAGASLPVVWGGAGAENNPAVDVLTNPGYAGAGPIVGVITPPSVPATTIAIQNPSGLPAQVSIAGGTVTVISVAPNVAGAAGTYQQVGSATGVTVTVPAAGFIKLTYSSAPTWLWTTI